MSVEIVEMFLRLLFANLLVIFKDIDRAIATAAISTPFKKTQHKFLKMAKILARSSANEQFLEQFLLNCIR